MQGFTFPAITDIEKPKLLDKKSMDHEIYVKGTGSRCVLEGQLLCKVSHSQLSLMQRKPNFEVKMNQVN